ncbi:MAG TPA: alpha/beta hydrolase-fold protein, partial [Prolixibacteraceae bacterium]|nr:alpha/beta hydrolase-fold protein [Prolixibacteraceae bacterium]
MMVHKGHLLFVLLLLPVFLMGEGRFKKKEFFSAALNETKTYFISYPDGYAALDTAKKYPVIIFLHSASVNAESAVNQLEPWLDNPFTQLMFRNLYKVLFVVPDGSAPPFLGSFYTNSALYGNFEDYISIDLMDEIRSRYNTYDVRGKWSIMGHSMGGYGCMKIALKNPGNFIGVASLSGP